MIIDGGSWVKVKKIGIGQLQRTDLLSILMVRN